MINIQSLLLHLQCLETPLFLIGYLFLKSCNTKNIAVPLKSLEMHFLISIITIKTYERFLNAMNFWNCKILLYKLVLKIIKIGKQFSDQYVLRPFTSINKNPSSFLWIINLKFSPRVCRINWKNLKFKQTGLAEI